MGQQHRVDVLGNHQAGSRVIGELRVDPEAELLEKGHRALQILNGQIDENLGGHEAAPFAILRFSALANDR
jgi:hypothetical protein